MTEIQDMLAELMRKGWTGAAIGDELGVTTFSVWRWRSGQREPKHTRIVLQTLDDLMVKDPPKKRRYDGTHRKQKERAAFNAGAGPGMKRCTRCKDIIAVGSFCANPAKPDGLNSLCKPCDLERHKQWRTRAK